MRFFEIRIFGREKRHITNPISTLVLVPLISVPQILGVIFWDNFILTVWFTVGLALLFIATYFLGLMTAKNARSANG